MCFVLYVGTTVALPRQAFNKDAPGISVESLTDRDAAVRQHFTKPEVQYVGSTSDCGCDFPNAMLQNGGWPTIDAEDVEKDEFDIARDVVERQNRELLVRLLLATGEKIIELYGFWDGENEAAAKQPQARETISVNDVLNADFRLKEQVLYSVQT